MNKSKLILLASRRSEIGIMLKKSLNLEKVTPQLFIRSRNNAKPDFMENWPERYYKQNNG